MTVRFDRRGVRVVVIPPDGRPYVTRVKNRLDSFQDMVGGYIEHVGLTAGAFHTDGPAHMYVNEDGKGFGMEVNTAATHFARLWGYLGPDVIVGTAIVLGSGGEGEDAGCDEGDCPPWVMVALGIPKCFPEEALS